MTQPSRMEPIQSDALSKPPVGVLALQGDYDAHANMLATLGAEVRLIRCAQDLADQGGKGRLDGIILPGGESTTMLKFLERNDFFAALQRFVRTTPTFGTCAGCILMANAVENPAQRSLAGLDITVTRNAYGRQNESSIQTGDTTLPGGPLEMVFIRAPRITRLGAGVEVIAVWEGDPVLVRAGHILASTFHPELSDDTRVHALFLKLLEEHKTTQSDTVVSQQK